MVRIYWWRWMRWSVSGAWCVSLLRSAAGPMRLDAMAAVFAMDRMGLFFLVGVELVGQCSTDFLHDEASYRSRIDSREERQGTMKRLLDFYFDVILRGQGEEISSPRLGGLSTKSKGAMWALPPVVFEGRKPIKAFVLKEKPCM